MSRRSRRRKQIPTAKERRNVRRGLVSFHFPDGSAIHGNRKTMWLQSFTPGGLRPTAEFPVTGFKIHLTGCHK